jgi:hypothetical protein
MPQAVSRRLPTAVAWVRSQVKSCRICGGHRDTGASFLRILGFPLSIPIPPTAQCSLIILLLTQYSIHTDSVLNKSKLSFLSLSLSLSEVRLGTIYLQVVRKCSTPRTIDLTRLKT